jgi:hypothetical protein
MSRYHFSSKKAEVEPDDPLGGVFRGAAVCLGRPRRGHKQIQPDRPCDLTDGCVLINHGVLCRSAVTP